MLHNTLLFRTVAVLLGFVILAAMPRQAHAADDTRTASFEDRWHAMPPSNLGFTCGGLMLEAEDGARGNNEAHHVSKRATRMQRLPQRMGGDR